MKKIRRTGEENTERKKGKLGRKNGERREVYVATWNYVGEISKIMY